MVTVVTPPTGKPAACKAGLMYVPSDIKEGLNSYYTGERAYYKFISCPRCQTEITTC